MREITSMTLEGMKMAFTWITWGELDGANSERGKHTEFPPKWPLQPKLQEFRMIQTKQSGFNFFTVSRSHNHLANEN